MLEYKLSTQRWAPVRITDSDGDPVVGVAFGAVTAAVMKADGTVATFSVGASDWAEATTGAFANQGVYAVRIPAAALSQPGMLVYAIASTGNTTYIGSVKVVDNEEVDTYGSVGTLSSTLTAVDTKLGSPAGASVSADIAAIATDVAAIDTASIVSLLTRALGLMHENSVLDQTVFDGDNNLTAARLRLYDSKANAVLAGAGGLVATYTITATYTVGNLATYSVVREP